MDINNIFNLNRSQSPTELPKDLNISAKAIKEGNTDLALIKKVHDASSKPQGPKSNLISSMAKNMVEAVKQTKLPLLGTIAVEEIPAPRYDDVINLKNEDTLIEAMEVDFVDVTIYCNNHET